MNFCLNCSLAFTCLPVNKLSVADIIGSVGLEYQEKAPVISCILLIPCFGRGGVNFLVLAFVLSVCSLWVLPPLVCVVVWMVLVVGIY